MKSNNFRTIAVETETRQRICRDCGSPLHFYEGLHGNLGEEANYRAPKMLQEIFERKDAINAEVC